MPVNWWDVADVDPWVERLQAERERQQAEQRAAEAAARATAARRREMGVRSGAQQRAMQLPEPKRTSRPIQQAPTPSPLPGVYPGQPQPSAPAPRRQASASPVVDPRGGFYGQQSLADLERPIRNPLPSEVDPWAQRWQETHRQGPQPRPAMPSATESRPFAPMQAVKEWGNWLNSTPAMEVYRGRVEENRAREYRSQAAPSGVMGPQVGPTMGGGTSSWEQAAEAMKPATTFYGQQGLADLEQPVENPWRPPAPAFEPIFTGNTQPDSGMAVSSNWLTGLTGQPQRAAVTMPNPAYSSMNSVDPLAAWRNLTRLPGVGRPAEEIERGAIDVGSGVNVPYDVSKSERLPWGTSLGEYAGAAWGLLDQGIEKIRQEGYNRAVLDGVRGMDFSAANLQEKLTGPNVMAAVGDTLESIRGGYEAALRAQRAAAPTDSYTDRMARINSVGGPEVTARTREQLINREPEAQRLEQRAAALVTQLENPQLPEAQRQQMAVEAADLGRQANELRKMTASQVIDRNMAIGPEIVFSFLIDPLGWMGWATDLAHIGPVARKFRAGTRAIPTAEEAIPLLRAATAGTAGEAIWGQAAKVDRTIWQRINPLARTPEALAEMDAAALYTMHVQLLADVGTKEDAARILTANAMNPVSLIEEGMGGVTSPRLAQQADSGGKVYWGGFLASKDSRRGRAAYQEIGQRIAELPSLTGEGPLDKGALMGELHNLVYDATRNMHGADPLNLPAGMGKVEAVPTADGRVRIDYSGPGGTVVRSDVMGVEAARARMEAIQKGPKRNFAQRSADAQRTLMSEVNLNMNPAYTIRNAASGVGHLLTDGTMTFEPTEQLWNYLTAKTGGVRPNPRMAEGMGNMQDMLRPEGKRAGKFKSKLPGPLGKWSEAGADWAYGEKSLDLGFLNVPVGEGNMYLRGFVVPFRRGFEKLWRRGVDDGLGRVLAGLGVDPGTGKAIRSAVVDAGLMGGRADVAEAIRRASQERMIPFSPEAWGIPADALTPEGWAEVRAAVSNGESIEQKKRAIDRAFDRDLTRYASVINEAPPQPGRRVWSDVDGLSDTADFVKRAEKAGMDPKQAAAVMQAKEKAEADGLAAVMKAAQGVEAERVMPRLVDMWADIFELKRRTRMANGEAVEPAIATGAGGDWTRYFGTAQENWGRYTEDVSGVFAQALADVSAIASGQDVQRRGGDSWDMVRRFLSYDEAEIARQRGLQPGSPRYDRETFAQVIDANRAFVDREVSRAWAAAHRYMDSETLDVLLSAEKDTQISGAKVAGYVSQKRDQMLAKKLKLGEYYKVRNQAWRDLAEEQAARWRAAQYEIVGARAQAGVRAGVTMVQDAQWPGMERELSIVGPVGKDPTTGEQRWRGITAEGADVTLPEREVPEDVRAQWRSAQEAARQKVDAEVAALGTPTPSPSPAAGEGSVGRADVPVHPAIPVDDVKAQAAWADFARGNPELAAQRVDEAKVKARPDAPAREIKPEVNFMGKRKPYTPDTGTPTPSPSPAAGEGSVGRAVEDDPIRAARDAQRRERAARANVAGGRGQGAGATQPTQAVMQFGELDEATQQGLDWRLLRGMDSDKAAAELEIGREAAANRRAALTAQKFFEVTEQKPNRVFGPGQVGVFKVTAKGRRRLETLDKALKPAAGEVVPGTALARTGARTEPVWATSTPTPTPNPAAGEGSVARIVDAPTFADVPPKQVEIVDGQFRRISTGSTSEQGRIGGPTIYSRNFGPAGKEPDLQGPAIPLGGPGQKRLTGPTPTDEVALATEDAGWHERWVARRAEEEKSRIPQGIIVSKAKDTVFLNDKMMTAEEAAGEIRRFLHPRFPEGVKEAKRGPAGLQNLINAQLKKLGVDGRVAEAPDEWHLPTELPSSTYYSTYGEVKPLRSQLPKPAVTKATQTAVVEPVRAPVRRVTLPGQVQGPLAGATHMVTLQGQTDEVPVRVLKVGTEWNLVNNKDTQTQVVTAQMLAQVMDPEYPDDVVFHYGDVVELSGKPRPKGANYYADVTGFPDQMRVIGEDERMRLLAQPGLDLRDAPTQAAVQARPLTTSINREIVQRVADIVQAFPTYNTRVATNIDAQNARIALDGFIHEAVGKIRKDVPSLYKRYVEEPDFARRLTDDVKIRTGYGSWVSEEARGGRQGTGGVGAVADGGRVDQAGDGALAGVSPEDVQGVRQDQRATQGGAGAGGSSVGIRGAGDSERDALVGGVGPGAGGDIPAGRGGGAGTGAGSEAVRGGVSAEGVGRGGGGGAASPTDTAPARREPGSDYTIPDGGRSLGAGGSKTKYKANVDAISTLKIIEGQGRRATAEEQAILARYVGWGDSALANNVLDERRYNRGDWEKEHQELKALLTPDEWASAKRSTPNAHYTSGLVVNSMYDALRRLGAGNLAHARVLEPGAGVGNFLGLMPADLAAKSSRTAVELDSLSGRILTQLYPQADVFVGGFQEAPLADNYYDFVVSNFPFGAYPVSDVAFQHPTKRFAQKSIHNYFFAKSMDKVRPGGVIAAITSHFTMDSREGRRLREYLDERGDFLGAIRLPSTAFKENAGTEVVTDVIFLRKRLPGEERRGAAWLDVNLQETVGGNFLRNEYFDEHPEMILGKEEMTGSMYRGGEYTVTAGEQPLAELLAAAVQRLPENVIADPVRATPGQSISTIRGAQGVKEGGHGIVGGKLVRRERGEIVEVTREAGEAEKIRGMVDVRDAAREVIQAQLNGVDDAGLAAVQAKLNTAYDGFVRKHGALNSQGNRQLMAFDPDGPFLLALERTGKDAKGKATTEKAAIFQKRVIREQASVKSAATGKDALIVSLTERNRVDMEHMAALTGKSEAALAEELSGLVYRNPVGQWETADSYLSGNVRRKLAEAEQAAKFDPKYQPNVEALREALPADIEPVRISVKLGAPWVPEYVVSNFVGHLLNYRVDVKHIESQGQWLVGQLPGRAVFDIANVGTWGTPDYSAIELIDDALNLKTPTIYDRIEGKSVLNQDATLAARGKLEEIQTRFKEWMWEKPERAEEMSRLYNDRYNTSVKREYDGSHLTLPGSSPSIEMRPHQKDVIWRGLQGGNLLMAHEVGAGKTFAMIGMGMELRRTGLARKPMYVVPNALLAQWEGDFRRMYPAANVLVADAASFEAKNRNRLMSQIATGDWDAVIVTKTQFEKLPVRDDTFNSYLNGELAVLREYLSDLRKESGKNDRNVKQIEAALLRMESKVRNTAADIGRDNTVYFEDLGVDQLFVDEAHLFKNLFFPTKMTRVAGLPTTDSNRAFDMFVKTQYLTKRNNGRGVVFATGTPISNSIAEAYTMLRYLDYSTLQEMGLSHFDSWAAQFGDTVTQLEMTVAGEYKQKTRFAQFNNIPVLSDLMQRTMDIVKTRDLALPNMPKLAGGERRVVVAPKTGDLDAFMGTLVDRVGAISTKKINPKNDNMLKISTDGRKAGLDMRLIDPSYPDQPNSKTNQAVREVLDTYRRTEDVKGTQLVFSDLGVPKGEQAEGEVFMFDVYADMKRKLVEGGIPAREIAFIHDAKNDNQRKELFRKMNAGEIRVLMGSTEKMGVGVNVQERLAALHHLDTPFRPSDLEQREGRILRQGNLYFSEVDIYQYVQEPLDAVMWQIVESKAKAIHAIMQKEPGIDSLMDADAGSAIVLSAAQIKAAAAGDPDLLRHVTLRAEADKLASLRRSHESAKATRKIEQGRAPRRIADTEAFLKRVEADIVRRDQGSKAAEDFSIELNGTTYTDRAAAGEELRQIALDYRGAGQTTEIGMYRGFTLEIVPSSKREFEPALNVLGEGKYVALVTLPSVEATLRNLEGRRTNIVSELENLRRQYAEALAFVEPRFAHEERLAQLHGEIKAIEDKLFKPTIEESVRPMSELPASQQEYVTPTLQTMDGTAEAVDYEFAFPLWEPNGVQQGLIQRIWEKVNPQRAATRTMGAPEVGDMAGYRAVYGEDARRAMQERLPDIVAGMPNGMSQAQRNGLLDWAAREGLPGFDDAVARSMEGAKRVADFAMLNYADKRNADLALSLLVPYHFWYTRSALNWLERVAAKPGLAAQYARMERMSDEDVERKGLPTRFRGTVPIPGTNYRMANPINLLMPLGQLYDRPQYDDPKQEATWHGKLYAAAANLGFGLLPLYDMAYKAGTGRKDEIRPLFWPDTLAYRAQEAMGVQNPWTPETAARQALGMPAVDSYDPYRMARTVAVLAQRGDVPREMAKWAQDVIVAQQRGEQTLPEMPEGVDAYVAQARQLMGEDLFRTLLTSKGLGLPLYRVDPDEVTLKAAGEQRRASAYGPENPSGSRTAQYALDEMYPGLAAWRTKNTAIPENADWERPGKAAARDDYWTKRQALLDEMGKATEALYRANPGATYEEKQAVQGPYWAQVDALGEAPYPRGQGPALPAGGMTPSLTPPAPQRVTLGPVAYTDKTDKYDPDTGKAPWELKREQYDGIVKEFASGVGRPVWPGDDASRAAKQAYYAANEAWVREQGLALEAALAQAGLSGYLPGSGEELIQGYKDRFKGPAELAANAQAATTKAEKNAAYAAAQAEKLKKVSGEGSWTEEEWAAIRADMDAYPWDGTSEEKRAFLLSHSALALYWKDKYGNAWWEEERRSGGGWGGGGGGGGGGGRGWINRVYAPDVRAQYMNPGLWQSFVSGLPEYRAAVDNRNWLSAGDRVGPDALRAWAPLRGG